MVHFQTLADLREYVKNLGKFCARPTTKDEKHYFLIVTEEMPVERLAKKLLWVADNMSVINDARKAL